MRITVFFIAIMVLPVFLYGQRAVKTTTDGDVVEGEFIINKNLEITLPPAQRIVGQVPAEEADKRDSEPLSYTFIRYNPKLPDITTRLRVLKLKDISPKTTQPGYVNIGFGNYLTPLVQAGFNTGVSKSSNYGVRFNHQPSGNGPVDKGNSGDGHSHLGIYGKSIGKAVSIDGNIGYDRDTYHFYGYEEGLEVSSDTIKQIFNTVRAGVKLANSQAENDIQYKALANFYQVNDKFDASESGIFSGVGADYKLNDAMRARIDLDMLFTFYRTDEKVSRSLIRIFPAFYYSTGGLTIDGGIKVVNHSDAQDYENSTRIFPSVIVSYDLTENITAYGAIDGDIDAFTFEKISTENPYVKAGLPLVNTIRKFDLKVGLKGRLIRYIGFGAGVRSALYDNMYYYVNDSLEQNKFDIIYDEGTTALFQVFASLSYLKSDKLGSTLSIRLNGYSPGQVDKAWHRPAFEMDYSLWYNFYDKVKLYTDIFAISGIKALDQQTDPGSTVNLKGAMDLNLKIEYLLSEKMGVFVSMNNMLNKKYELYYRYPTRGLLAIAGVSFSF